jgi:hypothetical protein
MNLNEDLVLCPSFFSHDSHERYVPPSKAFLHLQPINDQFKLKTLTLDDKSTVVLGRHVSPKTMPQSDNGYFQEKVLSRQHAKLSFAFGQVPQANKGMDTGCRQQQRHLRQRHKTLIRIKRT